MSDDIKDKIDLIAEESIRKISKSKNLNELEDLRIFYLGKKGLVTSFLKTMKDLEQSEKINIGKKLNLLKNKLINNIEEKKLHLNDSLIQQRLLEERNTYTRLHREFEMLDHTRKQLAARTALKESFPDIKEN